MFELPDTIAPTTFPITVEFPAVAFSTKQLNVLPLIAPTNVPIIVKLPADDLFIQYMSVRLLTPGEENLLAVTIKLQFPV